MKQKTNTYSHQPAYPNAADANYFAAKALQILAAIASGAGAMSIMIFLVVLA